MVCIDFSKMAPTIKVQTSFLLFGGQPFLGVTF